MEILKICFKIFFNIFSKFIDYLPIPEIIKELIRGKQPSDAKFIMIDPAKKGTVLEKVYNVPNIDNRLMDYDIDYIIINDRNLEDFRRKFAFSGRDYLLIYGDKGQGKTREAAELADYFNSHDWTILIPSEGYIDVPLEDPAKNHDNRKIVLLLDRIDDKCHILKHNSKQEGEQSILNLQTHFSERLNKLLGHYKNNYGNNVRVIATANLINKDEIEKAIGPELLNEFRVIELSQPDDKSIEKILNQIATVYNLDLTNIEGNLQSISKITNGNLKDIVDEMRNIIIDNIKKSISISDFYALREKITDRLKRNYDDACKKHKECEYVFNAIKVLQITGINIFDKSIVIPLAKRIAMDKPHSLIDKITLDSHINGAIDFLTKNGPYIEQIMEIEASSDLQKWVEPTAVLLLELVDKAPNNKQKDILGALMVMSSVLCDIGRIDRAIECCNKLLKRLPETDSRKMSIYCKLGYLYSIDQPICYDLAIQNYKNAIDMDCRYVWVYTNLGKLYSNIPAPDYDKALECFNKAIKLNPNYHQTYIAKGLALEKHGLGDEAIMCYKKALEYRPHDSFANSKIYDLTNETAINGNFEDVIKIDNITLQDPEQRKDYRIWQRCGNAHYHLFHWDEAIKDFKEAINAMEPLLSKDKIAEYFDALHEINYRLGVSYLNLTNNQKDNEANLENAIQSFKEVNRLFEDQTINPENREIPYWVFKDWGNALSRKGDKYSKTLALEKYDKAFQLASPEEQLTINASIVCVLDSMGNTEEAINRYTNIYRNDPDKFWYVNESLADIYIKRGEFGDAIKCYDVLTKHDPKEKYWAFYKKGYAFAMQGEYDEAIENCKLALEISNTADVYYAFSHCFAMANNRGEAIKKLEKVLEMTTGTAINLADRQDIDSILEKVVNEPEFDKFKINIGRLVSETDAS